MTVTAGQIRTKKTQEIKQKISIITNRFEKAKWTVRSILATTSQTKKVVKPPKKSTTTTTMQVLIAN